MKLYAVALKAWNRAGFDAVVATVIKAKNDKQANKKAKEMALERYPSGHWWYDQNGVAAEITEEYIKDYALNELGMLPNDPND